MKTFCLFLQVAIKNNVDVFYFATVMPLHIFFGEDGAMEKKVKNVFQRILNVLQRILHPSKPFCILF